MKQDIDRILIARGAISDRVRSLGEDITKSLEDVEEQQIALVAVMTGSLIFVADLMRHLPMKIQIQLMSATSYIGKSTKTNNDPMLGKLPDVKDLHVLLVDDILDSGKTLTRIRNGLIEMEPKSIQSCVLLRKKLDSAMSVPCEHIGFDIEDEFVVGYGLDYDGYYRNFPDIGVISP
ncbi:MAG TPA: hypoxanthine phosphoribosyltransferase [Phycisphaerales bacterium]|nr:hypoxanthine phosphoribosyltransferase [Phycisphaerales bacterium]HIB49688.1 hypoxanthine phosphoribosyltransferase [Phycisphaerales bacterium]HIN84563.1 hypoxanthine phosphoribosyltransferase [Phycisphaerales bacterium]HIO20068.1 hypoxanthine phosphoribosyltransferase [Phycisphaerales bacterium]HIO52918.1 hypoxanthine phosphoribosyltransferase [Phycisphaerales bacterium]